MKYAEKYKAIHEGAEYKIKDPDTGEFRIKKVIMVMVQVLKLY